MDKKVTLEVVIDYICSFCYLGMVRIDELKKNHDIDVKYIQCPLHPDIPVEGYPVDKFFRGGEMDGVIST
jgi:predicted DsbA family dithiol-disulfide isomerase